MTHILLVDDNAAFAKVLALTLHESGYEVTVGNDGTEGLSLLSSMTFSPDFVICDILMAGMDGVSFLRQVRQNPRWLSLPIVMMTSDPNSTHEHAVMEYGADGYLVKPFSFKILEEMLNQRGILP